MIVIYKLCDLSNFGQCCYVDSDSVCVCVCVCVLCMRVCMCVCVCVCVGMHAEEWDIMMVKNK